MKWVKSLEIIYSGANKVSRETIKTGALSPCYFYAQYLVILNKWSLTINAMMVYDGC